MLHSVGIIAVIILLGVAFAAASGRVESPVVERLGDVLYWGASFVAALLALLAAAVALLNTGPDGPFIAMIFAIFALIVWLAGRACRYVLAGR
jgi:hypothetical protein